MRATGIIAEYNPFHNGHAYHAAQARARSDADVVIAVMSGHITQRGEIAVFDKWQRAKAAVSDGVDLVLELPTVFAVRSAQYFATGGIQLLHRLGIVDHLSFGAEEANLSLLQTAAEALESHSVIDRLKQNLKDGKPYAAAMADALVSQACTTGSLIKSPNNILGIEYLRALKKYAPNMNALPIHRIGSRYHDTEMSGKYSSATALRLALRQSVTLGVDALTALPDFATQIIGELYASGWAPTNPTHLDPAILSRIRRLTNQQLRTTPELSEGLENRLRKTADQSGTVADLLLRLKSKRYPYSRLQRILAHLLLGTTARQLAEFDAAGPLYARVLALNSRGQRALRLISQHADIPIITKTTKFLNARTYHSGDFTLLQSMLAVDVTATDLFVLCLPNSDNRKGGLDFCRSAFHLPEG